MTQSAPHSDKSPFTQKYQNDNIHTWVAQFVKHLTLGFSSDQELRGVGSSPTLSSILNVDAAWDSRSALPPSSCSLSL